MMKSFFKKLAFVMALAMVVSMVAPAGSALAATSGVAHQVSKEVVTTYEFEKAGDTVDFCFLGAPKDWKTTFKWTSDNEAVATVDKAGVVTAVAAGTATITITAGADASYAESVVITVKGEVEVNAFVVKQTTTDDITLTFDEAKLVAVEDLTVNQVYENGVKVEIPVAEVTVKENVATVALYSELEHEALYEVTYKDTTETFVGSIGEVASVAFDYTSIDVNKPYLKYPGIAYVSTETEPMEVKLNVVLFDATGVDVTKAYDLNDFEISYEVAVENENYDLVDDVITFEKAVPATIKLMVEWYDEEGNLFAKPCASTVRATKRPNLTLTYVGGGLRSDSNADRVYDFTQNPWGYYWSTGKVNTTYTLKADGANDNIQFAAKIADNRGNTIVTGQSWYGTSYGSFVFKSSNENLFTIDEQTGVITPDGEKTGTGSVLVYFVNNEDENEKEIFVGSTKITFKAPAYPAKYVVEATSKTTVNTGDFTTGSFTMYVYDQYGNKIDLTNGISDITVEASSESNPVALDIVKDSTGKYYINFDGKEFDLDGHSYATFKYKVSVDKEENVKVSTGSTSLSVKVYDVTKYYGQLEEFLDTDPATDDTPSKFYYDVVVGDGWYNNVDVAVAQRQDLDDSNIWPLYLETKSTNIEVFYKSSNGYKLEQLPAANIVERATKQTTGEAGKVYYTFAAPSKTADNYELDVTDKFAFTFNDPTNAAASLTAEDTSAFYATTGSYKVTLYTTKSTSNNTLVKMGDYIINVTNSDPIKGAITATVKNSEVEGIEAVDTDAEVIAMLESTAELNGTPNVVFNYFHRSNFYNNYYGGTISSNKCLVKDIEHVAFTKLSNGNVKVKYVIVSYYVDNGADNVVLTTKVNINKTFTEKED